MNVLISDVIIFSGVAVASYYLMSILQTVLHRDFGHRDRIRAVFSAHAHGHHGVYNRNNLKTAEFVDHEDARYNFAVVEFWIDNLMGTRRDM